MAYSGWSFERSAGEALTKFRAVRSSSSLLYHCDGLTAAHVNSYVGIVPSDYAIGTTVAARTFGVLVNQAWSWSIGQPIYVGAAGVLTQTAPAIDQPLIVGFAETATRMIVLPPQKSVTASTETNLVRRTAGEAISGHKVVRIDSAGQLRVASSATTAHAAAIVGLTNGAVEQDAIGTVHTFGPIEDESWNWTPNQPLYCGASGALTHTAPTTGFVRQVAFAETASRIFFQLQSFFVR